MAILSSAPKPSLTLAVPARKLLVICVNCARAAGASADSSSAANASEGVGVGARRGDMLDGRGRASEGDDDGRRRRDASSETM